MSFTNKFYTADLHFGHNGIIRYCQKTRPFSSTEEMDAALIKNINNRCGKEDILYILGDFAVGCSDEYIEHIFHQIRARKILILGNHDLDNKGRVKQVLSRLQWDIPPVHAHVSRDEGDLIYLHHYACRSWPGSPSAYHFYGHSHGSLPTYGNSIDVGVDNIGLSPLRAYEIKRIIDAKMSWTSAMHDVFGECFPWASSVQISEDRQAHVQHLFSAMRENDWLTSVKVTAIRELTDGELFFDFSLNPKISKKRGNQITALFAEFRVDPNFTRFQGW